MEQVEDQVYVRAIEQTDTLAMKGADGLVVDDAVVSFKDGGTGATAYIEAVQRAQQTHERLQLVVANAPAIIYAMDRTGIITLLAGKGLEALGLGSAAGEAVVSSVFDLYRDVPEVFDNVRRALHGEAFTTINEVNGRMLESRFLPLQDQYEDVTSIICVATDATEHVQAAQAWCSTEQRLLAERTLMEQSLHESEQRYQALIEQIRHQALHDALTGLPNRTLLQKRLDQALLNPLNAERQQNGVALLMMDLDRFKEINDTFGHQHGDRLLQQVSGRLLQAIGDAGLVSRLGDDEFAILLPITDEQCTQRLVAHLRHVLDEPFMIADCPLHIAASIGIVLYPLHGADALTLMRRADVAMYTAKRTHEGTAFYDAAHDELYSSHPLALIGALRQAIVANELKLYYQPKVELKTGTVSSVEALVRWQHSVLGLVPPDQFVPLAEQTGLVNALTAWVLENAIRQCSEWLHTGLTLSVAVNLSTWNLRDATLPDTIMRLLTQYAVPPHLLRVEVTESAIMADADRALAVLTRLAAQGIHISVDDFGIGYSSLAYLKRLPIDELKIDRSFVQHMTEVEADATIVRSTVMLAHNLGLQIVAEGVEDQATWHCLVDFNCDIAQGYYMSHPIPPQELECWVRENQSGFHVPSFFDVASPCQDDGNDGCID